MKIIKHPLATEKSIRLMESENKLVFVVEQKATKTEIKAAIEELFDAKVANIHTLNTGDNKKKAYVQFNDETPAIDIATKLGLM
jgi:large subunit ribosomal protein L23